MKKKILYCTLGLLPLVAVADNLNLQPGLWETTVVTEIGGAQMPAMPTIPPDALAKMPPEQRARIEAMMASRGTGNKIVSRSCVTEKMMKRGLMPDTSKEQSCKVDSMKTTGTTQEMHLTCTTDKNTMTGVYRLTATSNKAYEGTMDMNTVVQNRPMQVKMRLSGKWLSAACGDVKPNDL